MHLLVLSAFRRLAGIRTSVYFSVSMHLLVLSAFRPAELLVAVAANGESQCTFWCSVLSDERENERDHAVLRLNAPFGAQCFPTVLSSVVDVLSGEVSMHLLVLSAFRLPVVIRSKASLLRLNAPFGAQCFPTC